MVSVAALLLLLAWPALSHACNLKTHALVGTPPVCLPIFLEQGTKLTAPTSLKFGRTLALSKSGEFLAVGSASQDVSLAVVHTYARVNDAWTPSAPALEFPGLFDPSFGTDLLLPPSVALSGDGSVLAVGRHSDFTVGSKVWLFDRSASGVWEATATLDISLGYQPELHLALSADSLWLAVGVSTGFLDDGGTLVYFRDTATQEWKEAGPRLSATGLAGTVYPGDAVALSDDGATLAIGASGMGDGAAWIFTRSKTGKYREQAGPLIGLGVDNQGKSVALSGNGRTLVVGAPGGSRTQMGAYVYTRAGTAWTRSPLLTVQKNIETLGDSVAISSDGRTVVLGFYPLRAFGVGGAYAFVFRNGQWLQLGNKITGARDVGDPKRGSPLALSGDGRLLVIAGWSTLDPGYAWTFKR